MHPQYTAIYRNVTRHSTLDSTFRWLSLPTRFWYIASPCSISLNFGVPRHSTAARAVCAPASAANCRSKVTYFKERKRTDYLGNARHTRGRLEGREDEFHAFFESFFTLPMPALRPPLRAHANDFVASGIPRPPFPPSSPPPLSIRRETKASCPLF